MKPSKSTKDRILALATALRELRTPEIVKRLGISRQTAAEHLRNLVAEKKLIKIGSTRSARYVPYSSRKAGAIEEAARFSKTLRLAGLDEDAVFQEAAGKLRLKRLLSERAYAIVSYAFTEMLNNAIDHSRSPAASVGITLSGGSVLFSVADRGIGAFESVRKKFRLKDEFEAAEHLLKGKQTTDPKRHSGQGIFFTSKIADLFQLESGTLRLTVDDRVKDTFFEGTKPQKGTRVSFQIKKASRKDLKNLFDSFSGEDYEFDKTHIIVHLSERPGVHVSRSEAKRILFGLDSFRRITVDFKKVKSIGQGFADEIFRVFAAAHPQIRIEPIDMLPAVAFMVRRAGAGRE